MLRLLMLVAVMCVSAMAQRRILAVSATSGDYIEGAGGTLAGLIREGWRVDVVIYGNDDKAGGDGSPARTRLANIQEGKAAAKLLGVRDVILMDHVSGQFGAVSSTEMRNQLFGLIRHVKPAILFIPDPYVSFQPDHDIRALGLLADEAWGYSGGRTFANELERMGFPPYGAPEIYYYAVGRPHRPGEGGVGRARFVARDISGTVEQKITAAELMHSRRRDSRIADVRAWLSELAVTVGAKHGFAAGEEFNHVGPGGDELPDYVLQRARKKQ